MLDNFYAEVKKVSRATGDLSEAQKAVVLIRVAIEGSAGEVGLAPTMHLLSKLMTITLGIMANDEDLSFEDTLDDLDVDGLTPN
jgi:hypothetical protein